MIAPRLRLGYSFYSPGAVLNNGQPSGTNVVQYTVMPSILIDYNWSPNLTLEAEIGAQRTYGVQPGVKTSDAELFATIGLRYSFDVDGTKLADRSKPPTPAAAAMCRYTVRPDGSCTTPASVRQ